MKKNVNVTTLLALGAAVVILTSCDSESFSNSSSANANQSVEQLIQGSYPGSGTTAGSGSYPGQGGNPGASPGGSSPGVSPGGSPGGSGTYCSFTQGGWGSVPHGGNPGAILSANFSKVFPSGISVGSSSGYSMSFSSAAAISAYLPAGGPPASLNANLVDPTSTSAGVFGGQVLTLALNVAMNQAGVIRGSAGSLADFVLTGSGTSLDGMTVAEILQIAEDVLGGAAPPSGYSVSSLNDVVNNFNEEFDGCKSPS